MYTMKILEREPALSHFLSAHLPPQWGRALSSAPAGREPAQAVPAACVYWTYSKYTEFRSIAQLTILINF